MTEKREKSKPLPHVSGEATDEVTQTNQDMERKFEDGDKAEVPKADRPGGLRGNPT
jgi:hypothetical protein